MIPETVLKGVGYRRKTTANELVFMLLPIAGILIALGIHISLPNVYPDYYEPWCYKWILVGCLAVWVVAMLVACFVPRLRKFMVHVSGWVMAFFLLLEALDVLTLKTGIMRMPFMPSPDKVFSTIPENADMFLENLTASMSLLFEGMLIGGVTGFITGLLMGWSKIANYWLSPVLKIIGPVPSAAWLPVSVALMPSSHAAGIFLIALAIWFPLTLMLSSAIRDTDKRLVESARVMGASEPYIMFKVALPSALGSIFTGLFMGMSSSFGALIIAEMLGVKAGLGWYISWSQAWSDYGRVFSTVGVFIVIFFVLIQILFTVRNHVMKWQKGLVRW